MRIIVLQDNSDLGIEADDDILNSDDSDFLGAESYNRARRTSKVSFNDFVEINEHGVGLL